MRKTHIKPCSNPKIVYRDRPLINLVGQNMIQAYNSEKFEFPLNSCDVGVGMWSPWATLQATVK